MPNWVFPAGRRFAFTILDDTDVATVENVAPVYRLLEELGMRTTKTVWPVGCPEGSADFSSSETLEDPRYRDFVIDLQCRGFEVTWHAATMESSTRERTILGLERFHEVLGRYPHIHVSHAMNRENLYWGHARVDSRALRRLLKLLSNLPDEYFQGHVDGSPYWWGDLCARHIEYARNLTFNDINTASFNPSIPYQDPVRPLARWWFSSTDADDADAFANLLEPRNQERLEEQGGICIVATHFGKRFSANGRVHPVVEERLRALASRPGWFIPVGELLDWLRLRREGKILPRSEWRRMQWRWMWDSVVRRARHRLRLRSSRRHSEAPTTSNPGESI